MHYKYIYIWNCGYIYNTYKGHCNMVLYAVRKSDNCTANIFVGTSCQKGIT